jgi:chemotaxis regulatin CheY-phosphate phosphatase CheZ
MRRTANRGRLEAGLKQVTQSKSEPPAARLDSDFEEIEAAVMETARGRWFLAEYARRNRSADTEMLLNAIEKLERAVQERQTPEGLGHLRRDLMEMATAIAQTRCDLAAIPAKMGGETGAPAGGAELESIVAMTEKATSDILSAAEQIQEIAWTLREQGVAAVPCDALDAHATDIYTACSFQDLTGQRIGKVIAVLNATEKRLGGLVDAWGLDDIEVKPAGAPEDGAVMAENRPEPTSSQHDIDRLLIGAPAKDTAATEPAGAPGTTREGSLELFDRLAAELEAATRLGTPAASPSASSPAPSPAPSPATECADAPPADITEPPAPEPSAGNRQDQSLDLDRLSQAHKTALFS